MTVKLAPEFFWTSGHLDLLGDDGKTIEFQFRGKFRRLRRSARIDLENRINKRIFASLGNAAPEHIKAELEGPLKDVAPISGDREVLEIVLADWDVKAADGSAVPFEDRDEVFEVLDGLEGAFVRAYFDARKAHEDAVKNSRAPSTTGAASTAPTTE